MKSLRQALVVGAGACALVCASAAGAYAYSATLTSLEPPGGTANDPDIVITTTGFAVTCMAASGTATTASPPSSGPPSGTLNTLTLNNCVGPLAIPMYATMYSSWAITATGPSSGPLAVALHLSDHDGLCAFDLTGSAGTSYALSPPTLTSVGWTTLTVSNVDGCFGLTPEGSAASLSGSFAVV